jgi:RHS repeat-associated protein
LLFFQQGSNARMTTTKSYDLIGEVANGSLVRSYVWGNDLSGSQQGAGGVAGLLEVSYYGTQTTNCFAAYDGNGNLCGLVNAADGTLAARYEYGPFGELIRATGPMAKLNPFRFSTKYQDDESDFLYYGYRYYNQSTGRWLSRDPIGEQRGRNLYGFVFGDPISRWDRLGLADSKSKACCDHACDVEGAREVTDALSLLLPGDQNPGEPNAVDEMAKEIKMMVKIACKKKPYNYLEDATPVVDLAAGVAREKEVQNFGVKVRTRLVYRTCVKGHCGGLKGFLKKILGTCSPLHWQTDVTDLRPCKPKSAEAHWNDEAAFLYDETAQNALPRCKKEHQDEFEQTTP